MPSKIPHRDKILIARWMTDTSLALERCYNVGCINETWLPFDPLMQGWHLDYEYRLKKTNLPVSKIKSSLTDDELVDALAKRVIEDLLFNIGG